MSDDHAVPHALYRFRGPDGELLYVGKTSPLRRADEHRRTKLWITQAVRIDLEWVPAEVVHEAERRAIQAERPRYNIQYNRGRLKIEVEAELPGSGAGLVVLVAGAAAGVLAAKWGAESLANWMVRRRAGRAGIPIELPPVQNPFVEEPPSLPLKLIHALLATSGSGDRDTDLARYRRLIGERPTPSQPSDP
jgi:hypothetical protein